MRRKRRRGESELLFPAYIEIFGVSQAPTLIIQIYLAIKLRFNNAAKISHRWAMVMSEMGVLCRQLTRIRIMAYEGWWLRQRLFVALKLLCWKLFADVTFWLLLATLDILSCYNWRDDIEIHSSWLIPLERVYIPLMLLFAVCS